MATSSLTTALTRLRQLPAGARLLELERRFNTGSPSGFAATVSERYAPASPDATFELPVKLVSWDIATRIGPLPSYLRALPEAVEPMLVHPDVATAMIGGLPPGALSGDAEPLRVAPTASGRTVAIIGRDGAVDGFAKLHYPAILGRYRRALPLYQLLASLDVSRDIQQARDDVPPQASFLLERGGVFIESNAGAGFGTIFRDAQPWPHVATDMWLVPAFSLCMGGPRMEVSVALARMLLGDCDDAMEALDRVVAPLLSVYRWMVLRRGLIPECNAQNVLFAVRPGTGHAWIAVIRDFSDVFVDLAVRREQGLEHSFTRYKLLGDNSGDDDTFRRRSFAYDFKLSHYLLRPLLETLAAAHGVRVATLSRHVAAMGRALFPVGYFDSEHTWYCYSRTNSASRVDYVARTDPEFR